MAIDSLAGFDFSAREQPDAGLELRDLLEGWLRYQLLTETTSTPSTQGRPTCFDFVALGEIIR
jgi:hypothetical protein